jgi:hypothetical protein
VLVDVDRLEHGLPDLLLSRKVSYNSPSSGDLNHLTHLSFDVYGVGNIADVVVNYELYRVGVNGESDPLIDAGSGSNGVVLDENGQPIRTGLALTRMASLTTSTSLMMAEVTAVCIFNPATTSIMP